MDAILVFLEDCSLAPGTVSASMAVALVAWAVVKWPFSFFNAGKPVNSVAVLSAHMERFDAALPLIEQALAIR